MPVSSYPSQTWKAVTADFRRRTVDVLVDALPMPVTSCKSSRYYYQISAVTLYDHEYHLLPALNSGLKWMSVSVNLQNILGVRHND